MDFSRPVWCLCGLPFDAVTMAAAVKIVKQSINENKSCFLSTPNLNFLIAAQHDMAFRESVLNSDLSIADGMPLIWIAKLLKVPLPERVAGSGLMEVLFAEKTENPVKVYFFGGEEGAGERACQTINQTHAGLRAVGNFCPGFGSIETMSSNEIIAEINRHNIDFLIVSLGAKKGQAWIEMNRQQLKAPVVSHLGAVVNFFAGTVKRAPSWMQRVGLEWLWRIFEEPALWRRYFYDGLRFGRLLFTHVFPYAIWMRLNRQQLSSNKPAGINIRDNSQQNTVTIVLSGCCTVNNIKSFPDIFNQAVLQNKNIILDCNEVTVIDGAFIGLCMLLFAQAKKAGNKLKLVNLSKSNHKVLCWLNAVFLTE